MQEQVQLLEVLQCHRKRRVPPFTRTNQGIHDAVVNAIGARFDQVDLLRTFLYMRWSLPAFIGPGGETLNQFQRILDTYGPHLKNLLVWYWLLSFSWFSWGWLKIQTQWCRSANTRWGWFSVLIWHKGVGGWIDPELLNDLIQENPTM